MFGMDFIFNDIPDKLDPFDYEAFAASPIAFVTGVSDVETGKPVYFSKEAAEITEQGSVTFVNPGALSHPFYGQPTYAYIVIEKGRIFPKIVPVV